MMTLEWLSLCLFVIVVGGITAVVWPELVEELKTRW
jgi:hypothetical protein